MCEPLELLPEDFPFLALLTKPSEEHPLWDGLDAWLGFAMEVLE